MYILDTLGFSHSSDWEASCLETFRAQYKHIGKSSTEAAVLPCLLRKAIAPSILLLMFKQEAATVAHEVTNRDDRSPHKISTKEQHLAQIYPFNDIYFESKHSTLTAKCKPSAVSQA